MNGPLLPVETSTMLQCSFTEPAIHGIADAFQIWRGAKATPLEAKGIGRTFTGFRKGYRPLL